MNGTVLKPSYGIPHYDFENPFESSLKRKHRTCAINFRPTWSCPVITYPIDFQQNFKHLSDNDQFEEKFLGNNDTSGDGIIFHFTPILPNIKDKMENIEFSENWDLKPEMLKTNGLQISKRELWSNLIHEESTPTNTLFEEIRQIPVPPLQFDDPLQVSSSPLSPAIPSENIVPQTPLAPANLKMSPKDMFYPETPACDYFMEFLASKLGDLHIFRDSETKVKVSIQSEIEGKGQDLTEFQKETSPDLTHQSDSLTVKDVEAISTSNSPIEVNFDQASSTIERIILELPNFAIKTVRLMEDHISTCLKNLSDLKLSFITDLLESYPTGAELKPSITRSYLCKVKEEISNASLDSTRKNYVKTLEKLLPTLLSMHGVNKALDIFLNVDYDLALETLADFQKTHEKVLESDYKLLLFRLLRLLPGSRTELHPKLTEARAIVLEHMCHDKTGGKVWIRLQRHASEVGCRIFQLFTVADIPCEIDPHIMGSETTSVFLPSGNSPIIIAEQMPNNFPPSMLSLIVHYEQPNGPSSNMDYASIPQRVLEINRPVRKELVQEPIASPNSLPVASSVSDLSLKPYTSINGVESTECSMPDKPNINEPFDKPSTINEASTEILVESECEGEHHLELNVETREEFIPEPCAGPSNEEQLESTDEVQLEPTTEKDCNQTLYTRAANIEVTVPVETVSSPISESSESVPIVLSSDLKKNTDMAEALKEVGNLSIYDCNYEFLGSCARYQPDVLLSSKTAVLLINEDEDFQEIRLKILSTSLKCMTCWILLLAPSTINSSRPPAHWVSLAKLARFYEMKGCGRTETRFQLKSRLALNYHQVIFIINDIAQDMAGTDIRSNLYPLSDEAKLLLRFSQFNAVSAPMIAEHFSLTELHTLPVKMISDRIPELRKRIKVFRKCQEMKSEQQVAQADDIGDGSCFGKLKPVWSMETENREQNVSLDSPSPNKRAKFYIQCQEEFKVSLNVSQLANMWNSPYPSNQLTS